MSSSESTSPRQDTAVPDQYNTWARVYDLFWRRYMNKTLPVAQRTAAVTSGERVLDLACGTGELIARIARTMPEADLAGVDLSAGMVEQARRKLSDIPNAEVQRADAHDLLFSADAFDAVVCANTFHYFTHPDTVLAEVRRVLRPDGRFVVLDWCRDYRTCRLMDAVLSRIDPAYETCYMLAELTALLEAAGFEMRRSFRYRFDLVWGMMGGTATPE
ncbi:MAG: SAM-dependent methyltransferase [Bacteroidetes bacterium SW_9_63_38]|nr:MAG: SAM-dependent methyltransferase [Bacteroidetes bacterium SW_9_63_38]